MRGLLLAGIVIGCGVVACGDISEDIERSSREPRHLALRPRLDLLTSMPAFAGDVLGIATVANSVLESPPEVTLAIEREAGFELRRLGFGSSLALAGSAQGFYVVWLEQIDSARTALKLSHVSTDADRVSTIDVEASVAGTERCAVAVSESVVALACSNLDESFVATCSNGSCQKAPLATCTGIANQALAWDGEGFAVVRSCKKGLGTELGYARLSESSEWLVAERVIEEVVPSASSGGVPAVVVQSGRVLVAHLDTLYQLDASGELLAPPQPVYAGGRAQFDDIAHSLVVAPDLVALMTHACRVAGVAVAGVTLQPFTLELAPVAAPVVLHPDCLQLAAARSEHGRAILVRPSPASLLVEELDLRSGGRSGGRPISPAAEADVPALACSGWTCSVAILDSGVEIGEDGRHALLAAEDHGIAQRPLPGSCTPRCTPFLTERGDVIIQEHGDDGSTRLSWVDSAGQMLWARNVPGFAGTIHAPEGPWLRVGEPGGVGVWRLGPSGPVEERVEGPAVVEALSRGSIVMCDGNPYSYEPTDDGRQHLVRPLTNAGAGASIGTLPGDTPYFLCGGGQMATFDPALPAPLVSRLALTGRRLPDVELPSRILHFAQSRTSLFFLLQPKDTDPVSSPTSDLGLVELTPRRAQSRILELPEAGRYRGEYPRFEGHLAATSEAIHLVWKSRSAVMLSSWPRE